jgi:hypothetical protein
LILRTVSRIAFDVRRRNWTRTIALCVALFLFVTLCWVPSFSLAQSRYNQRQDASDARQGVSDDRQSTTEWLLRQTNQTHQQARGFSG